MDRGAQSLLASFRVAENEGLVFLNRAAGRTTKLVAAKRWNYRTVKEIARVKRAVAKKFVSSALELICTRLCNRADNTAGSPTVFSGIVCCQDRELRHRVGAQIASQHTARAGIRIVIDIDAVKHVIVLLRTGARNGQLQPQTALHPVASVDRRL